MNPVLLKLSPVAGSLVRPADRTRRGVRRLDRQQGGRLPAWEDPERVWESLLVWLSHPGHHRRAALPRLPDADGQFCRLVLLPRASDRYHRLLERRLSGARHLWRSSRRRAGRRAVHLACQAESAALLDIATPGLLVAQALGRIGNFINQELYGPPSNAAWSSVSIRPIRARSRPAPPWRAGPPTA